MNDQHLSLFSSTVVIKYNNLSAAEPCGICDNVADQDVGPALFLSDSFHQVCQICGDTYAPELVDVINTWHAAQGHK
jgi:hypothetical protein